MIDKDKLAELQRMIDKSKKIVFFGGAGVSVASGIPDFRSPGGLYDTSSDSVRVSETSTTASGIPDFRGENGLYREKYGDLTPEMILSTSFFHLHPAHFFEFYREHMVHPEALPNAAHRKLFEIEQAGKLRGIVTQNIDGLHRKAGNRLVYELHGSIHENYCMDCNRFHGLDHILQSEGVPRCLSCGGVVKPYVVLYGEAPDKYTCMGACREISNCDALIVAGTSLEVEPAASFLDYFKGRELVVINKEATPADSRATLVLHEDISEVMDSIHIS